MEDTGKMNGYVTIESWKLNHRFDQNRKDQGWESLDTSHEMLCLFCMKPVHKPEETERLHSALICRLQDQRDDINH